MSAIQMVSELARSRSFRRFSQISCMTLLAAGTAWAVPGRNYFSIGGGGAMITRQEPCPDLTCNGSDTCSCVSSSGKIAFSTLGGNEAAGTYTLETSVDDSQGTPNGTGGECFPEGGYMVVTTNRGTLTLPFSGSACRLGSGGGGMGSVPFGISAPIYVSAGTGGYKNPTGAGTLAATFDSPNKRATLDLSGYGLLK